MVKCYLYNNIPGCHPKWSVAIQATGRRNADDAMRCHWGEGCKFVEELKPGKINADCGDISDAAEMELITESYYSEERN